MNTGQTNRSHRETAGVVTAGASIRRTAARLNRRIEARLDQLIPPDSEHPQLLHQAMRYSLMAGGKRIRPLLTIQVATDFGAPEADAMDPACAIEMIHTASLILDDLPCMDDATLRRGEPANHRMFGEDTAILAATALLNRAFGVVAECDRLPATTRLDLTRLLSESVGSNGIIAGQLCDLRIQRGHDEDLHGLTEMYAQKTGALFVAALEAGALVAGVNDSWVRAVREYALNLGLAFQLLDDLLDTFGSTEVIGKDTSQDADQSSLASRLGPQGAYHQVNRYVATAASALEPLGESGAALTHLARSYTENAMEGVLSL
jgi:geranylgeranyl diphosphate synthase type II